MQYRYRNRSYESVCKPNLAQSPLQAAARGLARLREKSPGERNVKKERERERKRGRDTERKKEEGERGGGGGGGSVHWQAAARPRLRLGPAGPRTQSVDSESGPSETNPQRALPTDMLRLKSLHIRDLCFAGENTQCTGPACTPLHSHALACSFSQAISLSLSRGRIGPRSMPRNARKPKTS